ncbi:winged helix-turn-helix domain-containing protein [Actinomadura yumaensis]|uniref:winged helix-turn-helix domain-containing protein n=1 Tax=Actinomadura yumaensis TaxID=111807 RepID=UPI003610DBF9
MPTRRPPSTRPSTSGDVLRLIREDGIATRTDLGRVTGLSRPAVASRVADLIARGLVVERADGPSTGGRPRPGSRSTRRAARSWSPTSASPAGRSPSATSPARSSRGPT